MTTITAPGAFSYRRARIQWLRTESGWAGCLWSGHANVERLYRSV